MPPASMPPTSGPKLGPEGGTLHRGNLDPGLRVKHVAAGEGDRDVGTEVEVVGFTLLHGVKQELFQLWIHRRTLSPR